jgi:hypothetical protein
LRAGCAKISSREAAALGSKEFWGTHVEITFTKGNGKYDRMRVVRNGAVENIDCPKQRIIPHDMVHYAVEYTLQKRGFLGRVRDGEPANFRMQPEPLSDGVERLVEVFQGDAWSGGTSTPQDMLDLYRVTCMARECPALPITTEDIDAVRDKIRELDSQWQSLGVGESMSLSL